jgi:hypothetical protein
MFVRTGKHKKKTKNIFFKTKILALRGNIFEFSKMPFF